MNDSADAPRVSQFSDKPVMSAADLIFGPPKQGRKIKIYPLDHGYKVTVGCQSFAVDNLEVLMHKLYRYLADPEGTEKAWLNERIIP